MKPTIRLYCAGGAAINIMKSLHRADDGSEDGFADLKLTFIDTSRSNLDRKNFSAALEKDFYHVQGLGDIKVDGSGKVRDTNYKAMQLAVPDILHQFPPGDLNILVHSASGGSGSTQGPVLANELIGRGKAVIVLMVGSTTCAQEIKNTINTILSYQGISDKRQQPVIVHYLENGKCSMAENDASLRMTVLLLAAVWSGQNQGLDSKDLDHFLNYQKVSQYPAALAALKIKADGPVQAPEKGQAISSVVSVIREGEDPDPGLLVGYHSFGTLSDAASLAIKVPTPIHLTTRQGYFTSIVQGLREKLEVAESLYKVHPVNQLKAGPTEDDGLVL